MKVHQLPKIAGKKKRLGRGVGSHGAKSGRGMKGQRARAGSVKRAGFEGGQTPLYQRLPKARGAKKVGQPQTGLTVAIALGKLKEIADGTVVGPGQLRKMGLLPTRSARVKLIAGGDKPKKLTVRVHGITKSAQATIEQAGGKVELIER